MRTRAVAVFVALVCVLMGFHFFTTGLTSGVGMFRSDGRSLTRHIVDAQRGALLQLLSKESSVAVALPYYARLSGFFRNETRATVTLFDPSALEHYESAEAFLLNEGYDAVVTRAMFWESVGDRVRGIAWNVPGNAESRDSFEIVRLCSAQEPAVPFVRAAKVKLAGATGGRCYTYTLSGVLERADLEFVLQSDYSFEMTTLDSSMRLKLDSGELLNHSFTVDHVHEFGFCMWPKLRSNQQETALYFPSALARNFQPLYDDFTGMLIADMESKGIE